MCLYVSCCCKQRFKTPGITMLVFVLVVTLLASGKVSHIYREIA